MYKTKEEALEALKGVREKVEKYRESIKDAEKSIEKGKKQMQELLEMVKEKEAKKA